MSPREPPLLLLQGSDDKIVFTRNSERLAAKPDAVGVPAVCASIRIWTTPASSSRSALPRLAPTLRDTLDFIAARGGGGAPECLAATERSD